jgi:hypothetical protein
MAGAKAMTHRFKKHYTREEARGLLPQLREWLERLDELRQRLEGNQDHLGDLMATGQDLGGEVVNRTLTIVLDMKDVLQKFEQRGIIVKDLRRGLVDFPAIIGEKEVFLCWEKDEDDVEFWHDMDSGYAGREPL